MPPPRLVDLPPANRIFVDREAPQRVFEKAAFAIPADHAILRVFYGIGGQGKTALCQELIRKCDADSSYRFLRRALLDLHNRPKTDADLLLVWIRNGFAEAGIDLPAFDLALALTWEATRGEAEFPKLSRPWLGRASGGARNAIDEGVDWLGTDTAKALVGDLLGEVPVLGFLARRLGGWAIDASKRAYLERTREWLGRLYDGYGALLPPSELSKQLPWMLAQDLNHHLRANPDERLVLFVDEYEGVFDQGGAGRRWVENPFDRYMRALIGETNGLLAVFFSRERLPWGQDPDWRDALADHQHLLGGLADADADAFLSAVPVTDAAIRKAIISGARETSAADAPVYPLMLDLQVEHWRSLAERGAATPEQFRVEAETFEARCIEMIERVLRDYGDPLQATMERLSVAQRFDRAAFAHVVATFGTGLPLDSFERIADLSFVTRAPDGFLSLHNVVAAAIRSRLDADRLTSSVAALLDHFEARARAPSSREFTEAHLLALVEAAYLRRLQGAAGYADWLSEASTLLRTAARHKPLASLWREAHGFVEAALGPEHPDTAASLYNLADVLEAQGDYASAKPLLHRAWAISEVSFGLEHPNTAASLNNFALLLRDQGDYVAAKPLFERALAIYEAALGPDHPSTATSLHNLAALLRDQGDYVAAKPMFERALSIREAALGPDHPSTATSLHSVAALLRDQGDYVAAKTLFERALAISEAALGPGHFRVADCLDDLARLLQTQGDRVAAKPLFERALAIYEAALGPDHPDTATSLNNLAALLRDQGDYVAAKPMFERALAIYEAALGPEHPNVANCLTHLALTLQDQGNHAEAIPLLERALTISEVALGPAHPLTTTVRRNLM